MVARCPVQVQVNVKLLALLLPLLLLVERSPAALPPNGSSYVTRAHMSSRSPGLFTPLLTKAEFSATSGVRTSMN